MWNDETEHGTADFPNWNNIPLPLEAPSLKI
jgi:hypothetical protein